MDRRLVYERMRAYYDQRAIEYDDWWLGSGLFAERDRPGWTANVERLAGVVRQLSPARVLDVACGTGFLTRHLRGEVTALDQSPRMPRDRGSPLTARIGARRIDHHELTRDPASLGHEGPAPRSGRSES